MKRFHNGVIILDAIDVMCISFSAASTLAYLYKRYKRRRRGKDPLIKELKEKSPVIMFSEDNKPLKVPLVRGGDKKTLSLLSLVIKNEKLSNIMRAPVNAKKKQRELILLQYILFCGNTLLTNALGLRIAVGGSLDYTQIILIGFPSTVGGFLIGVLIAYPYQIASALLPLAILTGRGIEDIPDPYANCKAICKAVEKYHNNKMTIEMKKLNSVVEDASAALQLPLDTVHLVCVEEKLSLLQRYKLKEVIKSAKARNRIKHFNEFIKKFPECDADPKVVYEEIVGKFAE